MEFREDTTGLALPLPHPENKLDVDVARLRAALQKIDDIILGDRAAGQAALSGASEQWQNDLQAARSALLAHIDGAVDAVAATRVHSVNGVVGVDITLRAEHLDLGPANGPRSMALSYDSAGRIYQITSAVGGKNAVETVTYDAQGRVSVVTTTYEGHTRAETYTYNPDGSVAAMTATEA